MRGGKRERKEKMVRSERNRRREEVIHKFETQHGPHPGDQTEQGSCSLSS